jgi:dolichol-phosphate mannosyltransferase
MAYEILVVDDGSSDGMDRLLAAEAQRRPALRPLRHRRQSGQSTALATGVRHARAAWVATLDGDGQNDPADIPALWRRAREGGPDGPRLIAGHRANRRDTLVKRWSSRIANRVRGGLLNDATPDTGCGLKLFDRALFLELPHFDHMHRFLPALAIRAGAPVVSVVVNHRPRHKGRSHYGINNRLWVGIVDLVGVMWLNRRMRLPGGVDPLGGDQ